MTCVKLPKITRK